MCGTWWTESGRCVSKGPLLSLCLLGDQALVDVRDNTWRMGEGERERREKQRRENDGRLSTYLTDALHRAFARGAKATISAVCYSNLHLCKEDVQQPSARDTLYHFTD